MFRSELEQALKAMGLTVTDGQLSQFCAFNERLVETNKEIGRASCRERVL